MPADLAVSNRPAQMGQSYGAGLSCASAPTAISGACAPALRGPSATAATTKVGLAGVERSSI